MGAALTEADVEVLSDVPFSYVVARIGGTYFIHLPGDGDVSGEDVAAVMALLPCACVIAHIDRAPSVLGCVSPDVRMQFRSIAR